MKFVGVLEFKVVGMLPLTFLLILLFGLPLTSEAAFSKYITAGATTSMLRYEEEKKEVGYSVGLGLEYSQPGIFFLGAETAYTTKLLTLENRTYLSCAEIRYCEPDLCFGDVYIDGGFFELAAKLGYHSPIICDNMSVKLYIGIMATFQFRDLRPGQKPSRTIYEPGAAFDYLPYESPLPIFDKNGILGVIFQYKAVGFELRYANSFTEREAFSYLSIVDKLDSFYILLRYSF